MKKIHFTKTDKIIFPIIIVLFIGIIVVGIFIVTSLFNKNVEHYKKKVTFNPVVQYKVF